MGKCYFTLDNSKNNHYIFINFKIKNEKKEFN